MAITPAQRFIRNHEKIKTRAIYAILKKQKARFIERLEKQDKNYAFYGVKGKTNDIVDPFLDEIAPDVPEYLMTVLPKIMQEGAKAPIKKYKDLLPKGYHLSFNVETEPAAKYLADLKDLMLSQRDGSILKTTRDGLRQIMQDGINRGDSYNQIAKAIREVDPFVFSKTRAKLISVNEVGRAYGWANHEPAVEMQRQGYVMAKSWQTSEDDKVRPNHTENEAQGWIPLDESFIGTGDDFAPSTNEINCRCTSVTQVVWIGEMGDEKRVILQKDFVSDRMLLRFPKAEVLSGTLAEIKAKLFDKDQKPV